MAKFLNQVTSTLSHLTFSKTRHYLTSKTNTLFALSLLGLSLATTASASVNSNATATSSIDYNIAKGLAPLAKDQSIAVLQPFAGEFRILGTKAYQFDEQAKFSPMDFAVSWGYMAAPDVAKQIQVRQYDRYLNWRMKQLPIPAVQAMQMVSNMHIIPANPQVAAKIKQVKPGDLVRLQGDLVEVRDGNLVWRSSLQNNDVGDGACEVFRVQSIQWVSAKAS